MDADCSTAESSFPCCGCSLPAGHIRLRNPYSSELIPSFLGRIPEVARTLDLPLLHASRPQFMPPCLLLPAHTFLLPVKAPHHTLSTTSCSVLPHVLDCSFMPSHPHCLVSSCTGGVGSGSVYCLDLHTCRIIQAFTLPAGPSMDYQPFCNSAGPASSSSDGSPVPRCLPIACPGTASQASFGCPATSRVSCANLHRDPSCPLLFLGTSEGDVLAYDLRFPGGSFHPCPCLSLRGAHDRLVSGVRTASGPILPAHLFFTSGLVDGWIRLFDLRFPLHYSVCKGLRAAAGNKNRGNVPYPVEAVQPNPGFNVHGGGRSSEHAATTGYCTKLLDAAEEAKETASAAFPMRQGKCFCCSSSASSGGIAGIDLSPDGALLAVAHVRTAPANSTKAGDGYSSQVNAHRTLPQTTTTAWRFADRREPTLPSLNGETFLHRANEAQVLEIEDPDKEGHSLTEHSCRRWIRRRRREHTCCLRRGGPWRGARKELGHLEGETIIFSVSEGLRVVKTLAVADACAFTGVEFSANGKYLLQTGGVTNGAACMICQSCTCCCRCADVASSYAYHKEAEMRTLVAPFYTSHTQPETQKIRAQHTATAAHSAESDKSVAKRSTVHWRSAEDGRSAQESSDEERVITHRPPSRTESAQESRHRAQIVNLIQCNRVALLKSPADGALAFADTSLLKHAFVSECSEKSGAHATHANPTIVTGGRVPPGPQAVHSVLDEFSSVSIDAEEAGDCFALKLHVSSTLTRASAVNHYELSGSEGCITHMDHSSLPLDLRLYSPSSHLMERRRQAFWQTEIETRSSPWRRGQFKRSSVRRCVELAENVKKCSRRQQRERTSRSKGPFFASASSSTLREIYSDVHGSVSVCGPTRKGLLEHTEDQALLQRKRRQLPFPRCNSQNSLFLTTCGVLHPQWGRHDCFSERFLCTFWGGLVAGIGGSRVYPGLKLWHPATGVVLTCAEGPLATYQAVRCLRGHPDLSLGILATGGSLRLHSAAASAVASNHCSQLNTRRELAGASPSASGRCSGKRDMSSTMRLAKVTCAAVTLWSLEHRDRVLERALEGSYESILDKGSLRVDPSDEEQEFSSRSKLVR